MRERLGRLLGMLLTVLVPTTAGLTLYAIASENQVQAFWSYTPGALMLYGEVPDAKYRDAYRAAAQAARRRMYRFDDVQLVQTNRLLDLWYLRWRKSHVIAISSDTRYLLIDKPWMAQFADDDLECIFAHELGHAIDFNGENQDHPDIVRLRCLDTQQRADAIGRILCGAQRYDRIMKRYVKTRPIVLQGCDESDPVTR